MARFGRNIGSILLALALTVRPVFLPLGAAASAQAAVPQFLDGQTVVFLGDSITHYGKFHMLIGEYYKSRFPQRDISFLNLGVTGESASGACGRFAEVEAAAPDCAVVMYGMNDLRYSQYPTATEAQRETNMNTYKTNMTNLVDKLQRMGTSVYLMAPTPYDNTMESGSVNSAGYDMALQEAGAFCKKLAEEKGCSFVDLHTPLLEANAVIQASNPAGTIIGSDRIHPGDLGHHLMAYTFLKAQGLCATTADSTVNYADLNVQAENAAVTDVSKTDGGIAFTYTPNSLPMYADSDYKALEGYGFLAEDTNREMIRIPGMPDGKYTMKIGKGVVGDFSSAQLSEGVNIAALSANPNQAKLTDIRTKYEERRLLEVSLRDRVYVDSQMRTQGLDPAKPEDVKNYRDSVLVPLEGNQGSYAFQKNRLDNADNVRENEAAIRTSMAELQAAIDTAMAPSISRITISKQKGSNEPVYTLDFDSFDLGPVSKDSSAQLKDQSGALSGTEIVTAPGGGSGKALKLYTTKTQSGTNSNAQAAIRIPAQTGKFYIQARFYIPAKVDGTVDNTKAAYVRMYDNGQFPYSASIGVSKNRASVWDGQVGQNNLPSDTWHTAGAWMDMDAQTYDFYVNGAKINTEPLSFRTSAAVPTQTKVDYIIFADDSAASISEGYIDDLAIYESVPVLPLIDETFDNVEVGQIPSDWNKASADADISVQYKAGSDGDKVLKITNNTGSNVFLQKSFARQTGKIQFEMDYLISDPVQQSLALYFKGNMINDAVVEIKQTTFSLVQGGSSPTFPTIKTGLAAGVWHHFKTILNIPDNTMQIWADDTYLGVYDMRYAPDVAYLDSIRLGAMGGGPDNLTRYVDNIKMTELPEGDAPAESVIRRIVFDDLADGASPAGWTYDSKLGTAGALTRTGSEKMYEIHGKTDGTLTVNSDIGGVLADGYFAFEFSYNVDAASSKTLQFYLRDGNTFALSLGISKTRIASMFPDHSDIIADGISPGWHKLKLLVDMKQKIYYSWLDDLDTGNIFPMRNADIIAKLDKQYFAASGAGEGRVYIDNYIVTQDVTDYGRLNITLQAPAKVDLERNLILNAPYGMPANTFLQTITMETEGAVGSIYHADGTPKTTEGIAEGDILKVTRPGTPALRTYTIAERIERQLISLSVGDEEFNSATQITRGGTGRGILHLTSNINTPITPQMVVLCYTDDGRLSFVDTSQVALEPGVRKTVTFDVAVPNNQADGVFKILLLDGFDSMRPYTANAMTKKVVTERQLQLPNVFSDHMVLQRQQPVKIFGQAPDGAAVTVSFAGQMKTTAAVDARWQLTLDPMEANAAGQIMTVSCNGQEKVYTDVLVGDVFYGSGQSNMQFNLGYPKFPTPEHIESGISYITIANVDDPAARIDGTVNESWVSLTDSNKRSCSAIMYYLAETLRKNDPTVPIGIVHCSWGGTSIEHWMRAGSFLDNPSADYTDQIKRYFNQVAATNGMHVSDLYNAMARSVIPYTVKAAVWYQGESDANRPYTTYLTDFINDYRAQWEQERLPFFIIQLPGYTNNSWGSFRLKQWAVQDRVDDTYVVVTNNTGDAVDIHPLDKPIVGEYLGRMVLARLYDAKIPFCGPVYRSMEKDATSITLSFDFVNVGVHGALSSFSGSLPGFEIAGSDGIYRPASAAIVGNTIVLTGVENPQNARYGYQDKPLQSLCNDTDGIKLPAAPFRTDGQF